MGTTHFQMKSLNRVKAVFRMHVLAYYLKCI